MSNVFLFREDFSIGEKIDRIPSHKISTDTPEIAEVLEEIGRDTGEVASLTKDDFLKSISNQVTDERYELLINTLFTNYGFKGDKFNMQLYRLRDISIKDDIEVPENRRLDEEYPGLLNRPISLIETNKHKGENLIDFRFQTSARMEKVEPDQEIPIRILDADSGEVVEEYGPEYEVEAPARYNVEARVYKDKKIYGNFQLLKDFRGSPV